jgi:predicted phage terminase large subunit-like protein
MTDIPLVACKKCKTETPVTLIQNEVCVTCIEGSQEEFDNEVVRTKMTEEQRERKKRELDEEARQKRLQKKKEFDAQEAAKKELAKRQLASRRLMPFVQTFNEEYMPGWVHIDICRRLEEFSAAVERKESPRLMLFMPPRHGKSELASKTFPAWHLGRNPKHEVIASSYAADLAMDFSRKVRGLIADNQYGSIFPNTALDKKSSAAERWNTSKGGGYVAAGVGGAITGRGAHIGIIDDPIKNREDAESATNRQKIKDWYTSTFYTRLAPGGGVLVILTRWHDDDLAGWLIEQGKEGGDQWEIVRYPAIAVADEKYRLKGQALHSDRYPVDALDRIKRAVGDRDWSALYQQNPVPDEGAYFQKDWFKYEENTPPTEEMKIYQAWDFAIGQQEHNDYTVGATIGIDKESRAHILNIARGKWDALDIVENIIDQYELYKPQFVGVEKGQIEMAIGPMLKKRQRERKVFFVTEDLKTGRRDKQARARPLQGRLQQGMIYFPKHAEFMNEARNELLRFPTGKHDDIVDALAWCFQMLDMFTTQPEVKPKKKASWKDKLTKYTKGGGRRRRYMNA